MDILTEKYEAHVEDWAWHMFHETSDVKYWSIYCLFTVD